MLVTFQVASNSSSFAYRQAAKNSQSLHGLLLLGVLVATASTTAQNREPPPNFQFTTDFHRQRQSTNSLATTITTALTVHVAVPTRSLCCMTSQLEPAEAACRHADSHHLNGQWLSLTSFEH